MVKKPVILCIDDEKVVLMSIKSQLKEIAGSDYVLEFAEGGEIAFEILKELIEDKIEIPLAIVDYLMPGIKGDEVLIKIHELSPKTICIMLTGQADLSAVANAINHEALFRYMGKPWTKEDLLRTAEEAISKYILKKDLNTKTELLEQSNYELQLLNVKIQNQANQFYKFVPKEFLSHLDVDILNQDLALGTQKTTEVAVLFGDIRSFTKITHNMQPEKVFELVNAIAQVTAPEIIKHNGFIDKFVGDGILAIFFNIEECLNSVFDILNKIKNVDNELIHGLKLGFSINYGPVQMGVVGFEHRLETTIIGATVNIGVKLEKYNKTYGTTIIATEQACKNLDPSRFKSIFLDEIFLEGIDIKIKLYTIEQVSKEP